MHPVERGDSPGLCCEPPRPSRFILPEDGNRRLDPSPLHQVLLNLAVNARDTMAASNLTFDAQYAGTNSKAKVGTYVLLQVTHTGVRIPPGGARSEIRAILYDQGTG